MAEKIPCFQELSFDEDRHTYKLNGFIIPSVSTIMRPLSSSYYGKVDEEVLRKAADRGTKVHAAVENFLLFGIEDIEPSLEGYFYGFKKWIMDFEPEVLGTECRVYHKTLNYAGTADFPCAINGAPTLVDFKTTASVATLLTRVQTEAYKQAFKSHGVIFERKLIVQAKKDGAYHVEEHDINDSESWRVFTELLDVYRYIKKFK